MAESSIVTDCSEVASPPILKFPEGYSEEDCCDIDDWQEQILVGDENEHPRFECPFKKEALQLQRKIATLQNDCKPNPQLEREKEQLRMQVKVLRDTVGRNHKQLSAEKEFLLVENQLLKTAIEESQKEGKWKYDYYLSPIENVPLTYIQLKQALNKSHERLIEVRHLYAQAEEKSHTLEVHINRLEEESSVFLDRMLKIRELYGQKLRSLPGFDEVLEIDLDDFRTFYLKRMDALTDIVKYIKDNELLEADSLIPLELNVGNFVDFGNTLKTIISKSLMMDELLNSFAKKLDLYDEKILKVYDELYVNLKRYPVPEVEQTDKKLQIKVTEENFSTTNIVNVRVIETLTQKLRIYKQFMFKLRLKLEDVKGVLKRRQEFQPDLSNVSVSDSVNFKLCSKCHKNEPDPDFATRELIGSLDLVEFGDSLRDVERQIKEINIETTLNNENLDGNKCKTEEEGD